jgi:DNA polymerase-3 subunit alpha
MLVKYFNWKVQKGLEARGLAEKEEYVERLLEETKVIRDMEYEAYLLVVADFISWARSQSIPVGPGRGSAAGCLISYCLGITNVDPIKYGLLFERFLNPDRISMPDIDIDFCKERVDEVVDYVREKYGNDYVARIKTFGKLYAKSAIRDVGRVSELDPEIVAEAATQVGNVITQDDQKLERLYEKQPHLKSWREGKHGPVGKYLFKTAEKLEGLVRTAGMHAAGVVIGDRPLVEYMGLDIDTKTQQTITCFDMWDCERLGLIKFDLLSLDTLTQIQLCIDMIKENYGVEIDIDAIPEGDEKVWEVMDRGDLGGIFQMSGEGFTRLSTDVMPRSIEDLAMISSIYRPGPMGAGVHMSIIKARNKGVDVFVHESKTVKQILAPTSGAIVYQEQCMHIARDCAGYTPGETDNLRKLIGKKLKKQMEDEQPKFVKGMMDNGHAEDYAQAIWHAMEEFGSYGFNKSHAISYAIISYQTAYLKTHYPAEFLAASLSMKMDSQKRETMLSLMYECRDFNIPIISPDINVSRSIFWAKDNQVYYGLEAIKGLGDKTIHHIMDVRKDGPYKSMQDFTQRTDGRLTDVNTLDILAKSGAFDSLEPDRALAIEKIQKISAAWKEYRRRKAQKHSKLERNLQKFSDAGKARGYKSAESLRSRVTQELIEIETWYQAEIESIDVIDASVLVHDTLAYEVDLLGFYMQGHPLDQCDWITKKYSIKKAQDSLDSFVQIVGVISEAKKFRTKKNDMMSIFSLEDRENKIKCVLFPKLFKSFDHLVEDNTVVHITGKRSDKDEIYVETIISTDSIYKKGITGAKVDGPLTRTTVSRVKHWLDKQEKDGRIPLDVILSGRHGVVKIESGIGVSEFLKTEMEAKQAGLTFKWGK